ncbi:hypothetical protein VM1G_11599 [Cytospora mali]|uniref:Uncharacterized protein n=1 Tax=Cytospora mali TaxID=578113 RepID=A0A194VYX4_CYTMA|nr:hypothetical protein VM1G_11599 [Valsa mali]
MKNISDVTVKSGMERASVTIGMAIVAGVQTARDDELFIRVTDMLNLWAMINIMRQLIVTDRRKE